MLNQNPVICYKYSNTSSKNLLNLDKVGEACEDDATDKNQKDQEKKLFVTVLGMVSLKSNSANKKFDMSFFFPHLQRVSDRLQTRRVASQLQNSRQFENSKNLDFKEFSRLKFF